MREKRYPINPITELLSEEVRDFMATHKPIRRQREEIRVRAFFLANRGRNIRES